MEEYDGYLHICEEKFWVFCTEPTDLTFFTLLLVFGLIFSIMSTLKLTKSSSNPSLESTSLFKSYRRGSNWELVMDCSVDPAISTSKLNSLSVVCVHWIFFRGSSRQTQAFRYSLWHGFFYFSRSISSITF